MGLSLGLRQHSLFVGFGRGGVSEGGVRPLGVVELHPPGDDPLGLEAVGEFVQVDGLVLERTPEAFDEDVVHAPAPAVHGDGNAGVFEGGGKLEAGELAALIGVEDLRPAIALQGFCKGLDTGPGIRVLDSRQESTLRVAQSMTATRYRKPRWTGM